MTYLRTFVFAAALCGARLVAVDAATADADWAAFQKASGPAVEILKLEPLAQRVALAQREEQIVATARHFIDAHPTDPRRWDAALMLARLPRSFLQNPDAATIEDLKYDREAQRTWREEGEALKRKILAAPDASAAARAAVETDRFVAEVNQAGRQMKENPVFDLTSLRAELDALLARYPDAAPMRVAVDFFVQLAGRQNAAAGDALWREFAQSPNPAVRERAQKAMQLVEAKSKPLELSFTALDGRAVDLAQLRGKVVLIDFWATWCGPCIEELPNVKKVYDTFHAHGFEVVGVSLDLEHDRKKLQDFLQQHDMPWPQHFDGKGWKNELAVKYGINAVPAMFLLDQDGKVVTTNARGEKLEAEVKRLLKL